MVAVITMFPGPFNLIQGVGSEFAQMRRYLVKQLKQTVPMNRGTWQSEDVSGSDSHATYELSNLTFIVSMPDLPGDAQRWYGPDLPWAEDHFLERVSGVPHNPAPSYKYWPHHSAAERDRHVKEGSFSHTYPERMWPKRANWDTQELRNGHGFWADDGQQLEAYGIRFDYGDLDDVVTQLSKNPFTRQAYLPIFFPEDTGAVAGQRVPCTLGYHFIRRGLFLDCNYFMRSCDVVRHFHNDVYMAVRLTQWIMGQIKKEGELLWMGQLNLFISNLHLFKGDAWKIDLHE